MLVPIAVMVWSIVLLAESAAGVHWTAPEGWKNIGAAPMRAATYTMGPPATECVVYFFGAGQGGPVDANIERWKGQFTRGGAPAPATVAARTIHGLKTTTVDVSGDYSGLAGPLAPSGKPVPGYRLLGAIVEAPGGNLFIKFTGPATAISANRQKFEQLLNSFGPGQ